MSNARSHILSLILKQFKSRASFDENGIDAYRSVLENNRLFFRLGSSVSVEKFTIDHIESTWITPKSKTGSRIIMYTHGGGYVAGSINSHLDLASRICMETGSKVLLFNYRLAPEHPFPEGLHDVQTVYHWVMANFKGTHRICLAGDSAGGGLTLALLAGLLKEKSTLPECIALVSPWLDLECKNPTYETCRDKDPMIDPDDLKYVARLYTDQPLSDPMISPINNSFKGLPPILIQAGDNEVLKDDSRILARKLEADCVNVQLEIWEDMFHVWHYFARVLPEGVRAIQQMADFIKSHA